ncbi:NAD-dependent epimerase/dehydratase family protein [Parafrankia sp. EUN1f]|uniref:NAD-dependent epimerase/dehydratase family protein n=1 Tax=Parafrankia sp. EUN1f TaxID=102897 RepID=UPI0001C45590|nr:NAD-dependent epimerase/dehydratase family protein [Parafrankia sp. EUN1f]EFC84886.1 NAD-dependent epimerase/dehydratase [Parafrankia sp. EUN1f]
MRILVTGAAGFIGSTVVDRMLADGHSVVGLDDLSSGRMENLAQAGSDARFSFEKGDITATGLTDFVARVRPDVVAHLAAQIDVRVSVADPLRDARLNVLGTINVLEAARLAGASKVIHTSSGGSIYGTPAVLPVSEAVAPSPESPYAAGKAAGELYLNVYRATYGLASTALALGNVFGPRQDPHGEAGVVAIFGTALLEGRPTKIFGDGTTSRDYVYVADVADAFARCVPAEAANGLRLNIGTAVETTVRDLHSRVARLVGVPDDPQFAAPRPGELQRIALDVALAQRAIGWHPQISLDAGLGHTIDWIRGRLGSTATAAGV